MRNHLSLQPGLDTSKNVPYFDGMRGLAIFLVALGHIFCEFYFLKISWIGLNLFFVLSGYLITRCLFQYKHYSAQGYFRNFYIRRMLRIFPLYYAVLTFFFLFLPLLSQKFQHYYSELDNIQANYWLYTSNWGMIYSGMPEQPIFFHFWSLAVEEQFYFIWPVLFFICSSSRSKYILIAILLAFSVFNRITTETPLHAYLSSFTAAEPLLLGCLVCIMQEDGILQRISKTLNSAAILSIVFLCIVFIRDQDLHITNEWLIKYGYSAINIIITSVMVSAIIGRFAGVKTRKFFSVKWLRWLGKYSYSIYVFHWIILKTIVYKTESVLMANHWPESLSYFLPRIMGIILTLLISYFSYHYFEKHFLALKKYFSGDTRWSWRIGWNYLFYRQTKRLPH